MRSVIFDVLRLDDFIELSIVCVRLSVDRLDVFSLLSLTSLSFVNAT